MLCVVRQVVYTANMNIEKGWKIPKNHLSPEYLANSLWDFSNALAAGRWNQRKIQRVSINREVVERLGFVEFVGDQEVQPIFNEISISFSAIKRGIEDEGGSFEVPYYKITSTTSQDIDKNDIPSDVLDKIFEDGEEEEHPLHDIMEESDDEGGFTADDLNMVELRRIQEVEYEINHDGGIEDYEISYAYSFDNTVVHEVGYNLVAARAASAMIPVGNDQINERRPLILPSLDADAIEREVEGFHAELMAFLFEQSEKDLMEFTGQPEEEHRKRILGMISLLSSGFIKLSK